MIRVFSDQCSFDLVARPEGERVDFGIWKDAAKFSGHCVRKQAGKLITQSFLFSLETKGFIAVLTIDGFPLSFETKAGRFAEAFIARNLLYLSLAWNQWKLNLEFEIAAK